MYTHFILLYMACTSFLPGDILAVRVPFIIALYSLSLPPCGHSTIPNNCPMPINFSPQNISWRHSITGANNITKRDTCLEKLLNRKQLIQDSQTGQIVGKCEVIVKSNMGAWKEYTAVRFRNSPLKIQLERV